jgi:hypothetical protein
MQSRGKKAGGIFQAGAFFDVLGRTFMRYAVFPAFSFVYTKGTNRSNKL